MKRLHVNLTVSNLETAVTFYEGLFGAAPTVKKGDYAKWMLDDPRVNFSLEARGGEPGVSHLGIQAENAGELTDIRTRFASTRGNVLDEGRTVCCYAESDKSWVTDPDGVPWEGFFTLGASETFGSEAPPLPQAAPESGGACAPGGGCC